MYDYAFIPVSVYISFFFVDVLPLSLDMYVCVFNCSLGVSEFHW